MIGGLHFAVRGLPIPQGSKVAGVTRSGKPYLRDVKPKRLKSWRRAVGAAAATAMTGPLLDGPVTVWAEFCVGPRPKSSKRVYPSVKPDLDKLIRAVNDACTDVVWTDDSRVVDLHVRKRYGDIPGVDVEILPYADEPFEKRLERGSR